MIIMRDLNQWMASSLRGELDRVRADGYFNNLDIVCQVVGTAIVLLRLWKGWDFTLHALLWIAVAGVYAAPAWLAFSRHHPRRWLVAAGSLAFGWTVLAWFLALACALGPGAGPAAAKAGTRP